MNGRALRERASRLLDLYRARGMRVATAESCTGGLVAAALTAIAGSSDVFECSFVTYSNGAKQKLLGVPTAILRRYGAVSGETAAAMAKGALKRSGADCAVSITGIAGPSGGSKKKPVGLVHFAAASRDGQMLARRLLFGNIGRERVRELSVLEALGLLARLAQQKSGTRRAA
ncbi:MAG: CinA family protein [Xanthobacteraceae bacterium]